MSKEKELLKQLKKLDEDIARLTLMARNHGMPYQQAQEYREKLQGELGYNELKMEYEALCRRNTKKDLIVVIVALSVALIASILLKMTA